MSTEKVTYLSERIGRIAKGGPPAPASPEVRREAQPKQGDGESWTESAASARISRLASAHPVDRDSDAEEEPQAAPGWLEGGVEAFGEADDFPPWLEQETARASEPETDGRIKRMADDARARPKPAETKPAAPPAAPEMPKEGNASKAAKAAKTPPTPEELERLLVSPWRPHAVVPVDGAAYRFASAGVVPACGPTVMDRAYSRMTEGGKVPAQPLERALEELRRHAATYAAAPGDGTLYGIPVPGEAIFETPRKAWQSKVFKQFVQGKRGDFVAVDRVADFCVQNGDIALHGFAVVCWKKLGQLSSADFKRLVRYDLTYAVTGYLAALHHLGHLDKAYEYGRYQVVR